MGRKNRNALIEKSKSAKKPVAGDGGGGGAGKLNKVKKDKNVFKVTSQNKVKKAKQVQNQVKNIKKVNPGKGAAKASEKLNKQMDVLHKEMVVKQAKPEPKKVNQSKPKQKGLKAKEVADVLAKMDV